MCVCIACIKIIQYPIKNNNTFKDVQCRQLFCLTIRINKYFSKQTDTNSIYGIVHFIVKISIDKQKIYNAKAHVRILTPT